MLYGEKIMDKLEDNSLIVEILLKLKTLEVLMISKGIFTQDEYQATLQKIANNVSDIILEKSKKN